MKIIPATSTADILCMEAAPDPCGLVIFGATGDLARRKLVPALFQLRLRDLLPKPFFLLGFARSLDGDDAFRDNLRHALGDAAAAHSAEADAFLANAYAAHGDYQDPEAYRRLATRAAELSTRHGTSGNLAFYTATPPDLHAVIAGQLAGAGLLRETAGAWRRMVFEKPFGRDRATAGALNRTLHRHLAESQIFRIDHYLGKETVQNLFMLRFANLIFEPVWNRDHIAHVQITAAETLGVEERAGYYDGAGAVRDMFQNHLFQILALTAMEPPGRFEAPLVLAEKRKVLHSIRPFFDGPGNDPAQAWVRGQYTAGAGLPGYRAEPGVPPDSRTETYAAGVFHIDNWRWSGVPFCLRSGKRLDRRRTEIAITFRPVPISVFPELRPEDLARNVLVLNIQPDEGIELTIQAKRPGPKLCMSALTLDVKYREVFKTASSDAYERLLLDVMLGDRTLFISADFIDAAWSLLDPVLNAWANDPDGKRFPLHPYAAGSPGPEAANTLPAAGPDFAWRET